MVSERKEELIRNATEMEQFCTTTYLEYFLFILPRPAGRSKKFPEPAIPPMALLLLT